MKKKTKVYINYTFIKTYQYIACIVKKPKLITLLK